MGGSQGPPRGLFYTRLGLKARGPIPLRGGGRELEHCIGVKQRSWLVLGRLAVPACQDGLLGVSCQRADSKPLQKLVGMKIRPPSE